MSETEHDAINHPSHYTSHPSGVECITVVEHMPFNIGNAIKYLWRCGQKGDEVEDLRKAAWYVEREIQRRTKTESKSRMRYVATPGGYGVHPLTRLLSDVARFEMKEISFAEMHERTGLTVREAFVVGKLDVERFTLASLTRSIGAKRARALAAKLVAVDPQLGQRLGMSLKSPR